MELVELTNAARALANETWWNLTMPSKEEACEANELERHGEGRRQQLSRAAEKMLPEGLEIF